MTEAAGLLTIVLPAAAAVLGMHGGRPWAREWAVLGTGGALVAALVEAVGVANGGAASGLWFLGAADLGELTLSLELRVDPLSSLIAIAVGLVACCVQVYSVGYLAGPEGGLTPTRYRPYAATVSLFTAAMMLVIHADDLVLLLIGWEVMGLASYLLIGHHSERPAARAAAIKAFLVTRVGDVGVLLAIVLLLADTGTTSIRELLALAQRGELGAGTATGAALLLLAGVAGKSAQFPLHTWLPDAMEGPTPISALIHAATMVAAGVFLVARLLPVFAAADAALPVAAVIAAISMLGAALAALAATDLKRLLAWSTISQVAFMLAAVSVAGLGPSVGGGAAAGAGTEAATLGAAAAGLGQAAGLGHEAQAAPAGVGIFHLLSHAGFKALLFLTAGCIAHLAGSNRLADLGGLWHRRRGLALLFGLGLAALAGLPPLSGFWSKEAVLTLIEHTADQHPGQVVWVLLASAVLTTLLTGLYAGRAWALVALREPSRDVAERLAGPSARTLPATLRWPLLVLAIPTAGLGLVLLRPPSLLEPVAIEPITAATGTALALAGIGWALSAPRLGQPDISLALPARWRSAMLAGFGVDAVQQRFAVRPIRALARGVAVGDRDVIDAYIRAIPLATRWAGAVLRRAQTGLATAYLGWVAFGAIALGGLGLWLLGPETLRAVVLR